MKALIPILILIALGGAWYVLTRPSVPVTSTEGTVATSSESGTASSTALTIAYTDNGFSPATLTVPSGSTVTFMNLSSQQMDIASNPHPTHQEYDGTTRATHCASGYAGSAPFDECAPAAPGESWTFTFTKAGSWGFHNHYGAEDEGTVIVQ